MILRLTVPLSNVLVPRDLMRKRLSMIDIAADTKELDDDDAIEDGEHAAEVDARRSEPAVLVAEASQAAASGDDSLQVGCFRQQA